jgi:hypothetical protein
MKEFVNLSIRFYGSLNDRAKDVARAWEAFAAFRRVFLNPVGEPIASSDRPAWWDRGQRTLREYELCAEVGTTHHSTLDSPFGGWEAEWLEINPHPGVKEDDYFFSLRFEAQAVGRDVGTPRALFLLRDNIEALKGFTV